MILEPSNYLNQALRDSVCLKTGKRLTLGMDVVCNGMYGLSGPPGCR